VIKWGYGWGTGYGDADLAKALPRPASLSSPPWCTGY